MLTFKRYIVITAILVSASMPQFSEARTAEYSAVYGKDVHLSTVQDPETGNWMLLISVGQSSVHRQNMANLSRKQILSNVIVPMRRAIKNAGKRVRLDYRALIDLDTAMSEYDATLLRPPSPKTLQTLSSRIVRPAT
jgi:hypothetical protein